MEEGITKVIIVAYTVMKITRVSPQSKLDELILFFHTYSSKKITRVSLQSKLDELIQLLHTYLLMKITRDSLQSKLDELMSLLHTLTREIRVDNDISSSSFDCNETRVIFIEEYL